MRGEGKDKRRITGNHKMNWKERRRGIKQDLRKRTWKRISEGLAGRKEHETRPNPRGGRTEGEKEMRENKRGEH